MLNKFFWERIFTMRNLKTKVLWLLAIMVLVISAFAITVFADEATDNQAETPAEGYAALPDINGNDVIGVKPTATVNNLGPAVLPAGSYGIWDGSFSTNTTEEMPLSFVMQFIADQNEEDMQTSPFADGYGDFVITFTGIEGGSFTADGCYLAGFYASLPDLDRKM